ncbi:hypothetical protein KKG31_06535 [Patescibacteria group bacterium]|nr:hypothetical protein [Patescibacteria group bacterium]
MEYTTVDYLEQLTAKKRFRRKISHFLKEMKIVIVLFVFVSMGMIVFTNAKLFISSVEETIIPQVKATEALTDKNIYQDGSIAAVIDETNQKSKEIELMIVQYKQEGINTTPMAKPIEAVLAENFRTYDFKFNTLPPSNRLLVPSLGVNDPIVTSQYKDPKDFTNKNFDAELEN